MEPVTTSAIGGIPYLEICIRDHECEDGDILRVTLNQYHVMNQELTGQRFCKRVAVVQGLNRVDILAVNGTGFKGRCNHQDVNTGEIRISPYDSSGRPKIGQTQQWKLRGGAGSVSIIQVNVQ